MAQLDIKEPIHATAARRSGLPPEKQESIVYPIDAPPSVLVIVDTEEEFDWSDFSRTSYNVASIRAQYRAQRIFEKYELAPTYVVDYPIAAQENSYKPLHEFRQDGRASIGAHLHPWVNPPFEEDISIRNTYACNLPIELEFRKLAVLTETIEQNFHIRPKIYKAGRYGMDSDTITILERLGYRIDCSVLPW